MAAVARTDTSVFGRWWWTVDRWSLAALLFLAGIGVVLALAATPAVAERIGYDAYYFVRRQFLFLPMAVALMVGVSLITPQQVRRGALIGFGICLLLTAATLIVGSEVKGATRWLHLFGFSLQPSEFLKPTFAIAIAWLFAQKSLNTRIPGHWLATGLFALVVGVLVLQPDIGMTILIAATWGIEFFLAGMPLWMALGLGGLFLGGSVGSYFLFDHVRSRVDRFLDPTAGDNYQVDRSLEAFANGGLMGTGPGEGVVKAHLPDAHADFIFAVAAEEFGLFMCLLIILLFAFVVLRGLTRALHKTDLFVVLAVSGLLAQFGLQAVVNMASTLHLIPTKGMTLPFISYGGSSMLAVGLAMGAVLSLTRDVKSGQGGWR
ncbi:MAG: FtsW/RodA/SpoVE family cell cycle protein [Magnetospiraceae bacterium]